MPIRPIEIMEKHTYDPDKDAKIALAQLVTEVCSETEADSKITTHKGDASAHHAKTTSIGDLTDHDKAAHDALNIDADTVDGAHKTDLESTMDSKITTHKGDASAHHAKTGDNEVYGKVLVDTAANRPTAGIAGRWFIASDTLAISYDDGSAWTTVGTLGGQDVSDYSTHKGDASAHHTKTTSFADITDRADTSKLNWTSGKLLQGAGAGNDPTEIDPPGLLFEYTTAELATKFDGAETVIAASYLNQGPEVGLVDKAIAGIFNHANLSESKAEDIWHHAIFTRESTVEPELTSSGYSKVLNFGEEGTARTASSPGTTPSGIGGDSSTIWYCDNSVDRVYELNTSDFSVLRSAPSPGLTPSGIGGDSSTIWHCDNSADRVYELNTSDFSVSRSASSPSTTPYGIGGDSSVIWHCDIDASKIYILGT